MIPTAFTTCACGKLGYYSRKAAKRHKRSRSMRGVNVYPCPASGDLKLWHIGHLPKQVKDGRWSRSTLGASAPRHRKQGPGAHRAK